MTPGATILVVEDEPAIAASVEIQLAATGHRVEVCADGTRAAALDPDAYDLIILDLHLPGVSGIDLCRKWRERSAVPVLMLTARAGESDRVLGLEVGADDYLTKPFSAQELLARVRAILRRRELDRAGSPALVRRVDGLQIDFASRSVTVGSRRVSLTPLELDILALLASEPGRVFSRDEIVHHLWQTGGTGSGRACDTHIKNIRRKIEEDPARPEHLLTARGAGYFLRSDTRPPTG